jgi:hypothetical protein
MQMAGETARGMGQRNNSVVASRSLIHAAAMDQARANMRSAGRTAMDDEDTDVFVAVFDRLFHELRGPEAWMAMERE